MDLVSPTAFASKANWDRTIWKYQPQFFHLETLMLASQEEIKVQASKLLKKTCKPWGQNVHSPVVSLNFQWFCIYTKVNQHLGDDIS